MINDGLQDKSKNDFEAAETIKKPRVWGLVILLILKGLLGAFINYTSLQEITPLLDNPLFEIESWVVPLIYFSLLVSLVSIVSAVLIKLYKRNGLILGGTVIVIDLALSVFVILNGFGSIGLGMLINIFAIYYIYKYMTQEPEKSFFS